MFSHDHDKPKAAADVTLVVAKHNLRAMGSVSFSLVWSPKKLKPLRTPAVTQRVAKVKSGPEVDSLRSTTGIVGDVESSWTHPRNLLCVVLKATLGAMDGDCEVGKFVGDCDVGDCDVGDWVAGVGGVGAGEGALEGAVVGDPVVLPTISMTWYSGMNAFGPAPNCDLEESNEVMPTPRKVPSERMAKFTSSPLMTLRVDALVAPNVTWVGPNKIIVSSSEV